MAFETGLPPDAADGWREPATEHRLEDLYRAHGPAVYRRLLRLTRGGRQVAQDLTQEALRRAQHSLAQLDADPAFVRPWLFTVAHRVAIDYLRAVRARPSAVGVQDGVGEATADDVESRRDGHAIRAALRQLRPEHQQVVVELYRRGRSVAQTARLLGLPVTVVRSRALEALRALRTAMDGAGRA